MIRRPPRSTLDRSSAASDVYKRQVWAYAECRPDPKEKRTRHGIRGTLLRSATCRTCTQFPILAAGARRGAPARNRGKLDEIFVAARRGCGPRPACGNGERLRDNHARAVRG